MWSVLKEALAFGQRLVDQLDVALLEVAQTTVDQLGGLGGGPLGEVVALNEGDAQSAGRGVEDDTGPGHATADDDEVERLGAQSIQ